MAIATVDWRAFCGRHSRLFGFLVTLKRMRTKAAILLLLVCLAEQVYFSQAPFCLEKPNIWVALGLLLIGAGSVARLAALGSIRKKMRLATTGIYSICRHPLYLGSMLIAFGFCILLRDVSTYVIAAGYFVIFYPLTIVWEECRLRERYGDEHHAYCRSVPLLLPLGLLHWSPISVRRALNHGGFSLLAGECLMLAVVEVMAKTLH